MAETLFVSSTMSLQPWHYMWRPLVIK